MNARIVLVGAASRGLVFALPAALFAAWWSTVNLAPGPTAPPPPDLLATLFAALQGGAPIGATAAACAAVEFGWPGRGQTRGDLTASLAALFVGPLAASAAALQCRYALGVLAGTHGVLDYAAVQPYSLPDAVAVPALLSLVLAVGAALRRRGVSRSAGCACASLGTWWMLPAADLVWAAASERPPSTPSWTSDLTMALVLVPFLTLAASLLCSAADALAARLVGSATPCPPDGARA
ncbi:MAG: hypothetical protein KF878_30155 [Planctomycetes bacterium]|nr:hypothetical protein [Planctomycetota bacterium]